MSGFEAAFIKSRALFDPKDESASPAPIFRRRFNLTEVKDAVLRICALGYGYCYINGRAVSEDLLCAPVSEYHKLVWYSEYDVTSFLNEGENVIAVILGNGFFNESFPSGWDHNKAPWRDNPKLALDLRVGGEIILESDEEFLYSDDSFVTYNHLRSGETFDASKYNPAWKELSFDESAFNNAALDKSFNPERRLCCCEPIREFEQYDFVSCMKTDEGYLLDFGRNVSGYVRLEADEPEGTVVTIHHAEEAYPDGRLKLNNLDIFYKSVDFQVDRYICGRQPIAWSPKFTYHGFRFILVKGLSRAPKKGEFKAVFVHQAIKRTSEFECSDELINKIYNAGIASTYSNLHYALTDCPTREKLGWMNDAMASFEQIYLNFDIKRFMKKWGIDYITAMDDNGALPAIIPSNGWGFGHGPVADGALFALPAIEYLYTADNSKLTEFLPYLERHYKAFKSDLTGGDGWLGDWNGHISFINDKRFTKLFFTVKYCRVIINAYRLSGGAAPDFYAADEAEALRALKAGYITENGESVINNKCIIAMLMSFKLASPEPMLSSLKRLIEEDNFHINFGMLCMQYIYSALTDNGAADYAYKLITSKGELSYSAWFEQGATTLWETFEMGHTDSRNHHMLSAVLAWFIKSLLGLNADVENPGFKALKIMPCFIKDLDWCKGSIDTASGKISAFWKRESGEIHYTVTLPKGVAAEYNGRRLCEGENNFVVIEP